MTIKDFKSAYKTMVEEHFPPKIEISFIEDDGTRQTLFYEKKMWEIDRVTKGLRYGENPGQEAALYRLINGNLSLGEVHSIQAGRFLSSAMELLQSGKHPGKTNITDVDSALNILRHLHSTPCCVIVKHNNPSGVAKGSTLPEAYDKANMADRLAAFGGAIALNREVDKDTAELIVKNYAEVVAAPEFTQDALDIFTKKKNLRVMRVANMTKLETFSSERVVDFKSLIDGGIVTQWSFTPEIKAKENLMPAQTVYKGQEYRVNRQPTEEELDDLIFGWLIECGISSNSVLFVKDGVTVGIGAGEQDRVGVAEIARDKAYRKLSDRICWEQFEIPYNTLTDLGAKKEIDLEVALQKGGLIGSKMVSDAFFPFRDGIDVGLREGVTAVIQPGGSERDFESITACNEANAAMVFTGQRCFKH
ncbi:MAG: IMP cyclohydrolase [Lentisphaerae bacterium]|nr:IMP cyclohydrolase [Lentisphaerota bacterium]